MRFSKGEVQSPPVPGEEQPNARIYSGLSDWDKVKTKAGFSLWCPVEGQDALRTNRNTGNPTQYETFSL